MKARSVLFGLAVLCLVTNATDAQEGAANCGPTKEVMGDLAKKYHEVPIWMGLTSDGILANLFQSQDGKTWTWLMTTPKGVSCVIRDGQNGEFDTSAFDEAKKGEAM